MRYLTLAIAFAFSACAPYQALDRDFSSVQACHVVAIDMRTGSNIITRLWSQPHRALVYKDGPQCPHLIPEDSSTDMVKNLMGPAGTVSSHVVAQPW